MFKLHTNAKRIVKRVALLSCVTAVGALGAGGTAMANDVTNPAQKVHSMTEAKIDWSVMVDNGVPVGRVQLQENKNESGAWNNVPLATQNALSAVVRVDDGVAHQFRVRAFTCPSAAPCDWTQATTPRPWKYGPTFKQRVVETTVAGAPAVPTHPDYWTVAQSPSFSAGGTLQERTGAPFYATVNSTLGAYNIAPIGSKGPQMGRTTYSYNWTNNQGQSFSATHPPVTQTAGTASFRQVMDERRFLPNSGTLGRSITVRAHDGGTTDVDAVVLFEIPFS
jgi:hypothetical protein